MCSVYIVLDAEWLWRICWLVSHLVVYSQTNVIVNTKLACWRLKISYTEHHVVIEFEHINGSLIEWAVSYRQI